jgi:hypothetical protein
LRTCKSCNSVNYFLLPELVFVHRGTDRRPRNCRALKINKNGLVNQKKFFCLKSKTHRAILNFNPCPMGEICPLGGMLAPSFTPRGEHFLLLRRMVGRTEKLTPPRDNFTHGPRGQNSPLGTTSPLGAKLRRSLCSLPTTN